MIKGFFFDLDGTLVNTYKADYLAYRDAIQEVVGVEVTESGFAETHGLEMRDKLKKLDLQVGESDSRKIAAAKKTHYQKYLDLTEPNDQLIRLLAEFAEHHAMVLVTTAKKENAVRVLRKHGLEEYFSHMVFGDEVVNPKPDPEGYRLALERSGLKASEAIAFEDTDSGLQAAEAAGIPVIHVRTFAQ